jgi:uncharacterized protein (TIGR03437 family)
MRPDKPEILEYLSYSARISAVMLVLCADAALAQSSLFTVGGAFPVGSGLTNPAVASPAMVVADFNRDGKVDIVTANYNDGTLTLLLGDGAGHFTQATASPIQAPRRYVEAIATGDFNGDGNPDLVVTSTAGTDILLGDGAGKFVKGAGIPSVYNFEASGRLLAVADFNGDGKLDVVISGFGSSVLWFGDGTGGFKQGRDTPAYDDPSVSSIVAGDFNGDGKLDLALDGSMLYVYAGDGLGSFPQPYQLFLGNPAYTSGTAIAAGDFNGDGKSDVLSFSSFNRSWTWFWTGSTSALIPFNPVMSKVPSVPAFIVTADFNGDGKLDWAGVNPGLGTVMVELGDGTGAFTPAPGSPYTVGGEPFALAAADFNGDGKIDLAIDTGSTVMILLNGNSSPTEAPPVVSAMVNAASYVSEPLPSNAYAVVYGTDLAASPGDPTVVSTITDSAGIVLRANVLYAGQEQVNILVPLTFNLGKGTLQISNRFGTSAPFPITIGTIAPGLFTVDTVGKIPAAQVLTVDANNMQTFQSAANCPSGTCVLAPITLEPNSQTYLILYGTGIRGRVSLSDVSVTIGGVPATVLYAGPQGVYPGLDQVNVLVPQALAGSKQVDLNLKILANAANTVQLLFQ